MNVDEEQNHRIKKLGEREGHRFLGARIVRAATKLAWHGAPSFPGGIGQGDMSSRWQFKFESESFWLSKAHWNSCRLCVRS